LRAPRSTAKKSEPAGSRALRVAFYSDSDEIGGAEISLATLLGALAARIDAVVVGTDGRVVEWLASHRAAAETVLLPRIRGKLHLRAIVAHFRAIRRLRADILQVNLTSPWASGWAILAGLTAPGVKVVAVEHLPLPMPRRGRIVKRLTARRLAGQVAVGESSAGRVASMSGVPLERVRTIYNGVPDSKPAQLPRPSGELVVGSLGRLDAQKGFDLLVRALPELAETTVILVGAGRERGRLEQLAERLQVSERLLLVGWSEEARRHLTTFDVFVLPSRYEGGPPLAVIEAMLARLPVIATDVPNVPEAVVDGETGILVPPEDVRALAEAVRSLLGDPARRREMGRRGRRLALERFGVGAMASAYEALYDELMR
jgi:glycosyltransferase involved in cell wall biosynthesis